MSEQRTMIFWVGLDSFLVGFHSSLWNRLDDSGGHATASSTRFPQRSGSVHRNLVGEKGRRRKTLDNFKIIYRFFPCKE